MTTQTRTITLVVGTRPEAIKMAPLFHALKKCPGVRPHLLATGQHADMLLEPLAYFGLVPDDNLGIMRERQTLDYVTSAVLELSGKVFDRENPSLVLVHGDTTTTLAASLAAFYRKIPVGHVEAGLRSRDLGRPFPEEMNRVVTDHLASWWFPPTEGAAANLLREGCPADRVVVTGNTVIDALLWTARRVHAPSASALTNLPPDARVLLLTAHRRESGGEGLERICRAVSRILDTARDVWCVVPMHRNPAVREVFQGRLGNLSRVVLCEPLSYPDFVWAMNRSTLILSDSGGVQEEAPALKKPVLVLRDVTERPEALTEGTAMLVGTDENRIVSAACQLLTDPKAYAALAQKDLHPFGDGNAAEKICAVIMSRMGDLSAGGSW